MFFKQGRYSGFISPISYMIDLLVINLFTYLLPINIYEPILFHIYLSAGWIVLSLKNEFYEINRYSKVPIVFRKLSTQFIFLFLILYAFIGFFKQPEMSRLALAQYFCLVTLAISSIKFINYFL